MTTAPEDLTRFLRPTREEKRSRRVNARLSNINNKEAAAHAEAINRVVRPENPKAVGQAMMNNPNNQVFFQPLAAGSQIKNSGFRQAYADPAQVVLVADEMTKAGTPKVAAIGDFFNTGKQSLAKKIPKQVISML